MRRHADALIVGAGLAGLSAAIALIDKGLDVIVIDKGDIASGASGVPLGLINPAAAKQANLSWNAKQCMAATASLLERAASHSDLEFYRKSGVLRPSTDTGTLEAFRTSLKRHPFPNGWAQWLDADETDAFHPGLLHAGGSLWVMEGYVVDMPVYLNALADLVKSYGAKVQTNCQIMATSYDESDGTWNVTLPDQSELCVNHIITAVGASVMDDINWKWLSAHPIKGQLAVYRSNNAISWNHAVAARGYIAHLNGFDWVIGSTFEHTFNSLEPDEAGMSFLSEKVDSVLPNLRLNSSLQRQWTGVRLGTPNRLPIIGQHPSKPGLWLFVGLGSKGLIYSAFIGQLLAASIVDGATIPHEIDIQRLIPAS